MARTTSGTWPRLPSTGTPVDDGPGQFGGGQAEADHFHARVRLSLNPLAELLRRTEAADHDNVAEAASVALKTCRHLPGDEANKQAEQYRERRAGCDQLQQRVQRQARRSGPRRLSGQP